MPAGADSVPAPPAGPPGIVVVDSYQAALLQQLLAKFTDVDIRSPEVVFQGMIHVTAVDEYHHPVIPVGHVLTSSGLFELEAGISDRFVFLGFGRSYVFLKSLYNIFREV